MISDLKDAILLGIVSLLTFTFGWKKQVFSIDKVFPPAPIRWFDLLFIFFIYFAVAISGITYVSPLFGSLNPSLSSVGFSAWLTFLISLSILAGLLIYCSLIPKEIILKIWKKSDENPHLVQSVLLFSVTAFPLTLFLAKFFELFIYFVFHIQEIPDQLAVLFLKQSLDYPLYFSLAMTTIILLAPCIEETIFRGFLQSFIRQYLGPKTSIAITSFCFAFFHYAPEQKLANIPIIGSLFAFSLFLGLIYEKKGSLLASISLHAFFNAMSVAGLYFLGDGT